MGLNEDQRRQARGIASRRAAKAGTVRAASVPARGTRDAYGDEFAGLPGNRLRVNAVGDVELSSGGTDAARAVGPEHQKENSTTSRVLGSSDTNDDNRAVGKSHQKSNSTDERILQSPDLVDHHTPKRDFARAVAARHQKDNSTDSRVLASGGTDAERAVNAAHQKDNSTDSRVLASGATDAERAVSAAHQKSNSTDDRVLASGGPNESRAVTGEHIKRTVIGEEHQKGNSTDSRVLASGATDAERAVGTAHQKNNSTDSRVLASGATDAESAVGTAHMKDSAVTGAKIASETIFESKLAGALKGGVNDAGPPQGDKGIRKIFGTGVSRGAAASDHNHSVSFSHLPPSTQDAALALRERLRAVAGRSGEMGDLARGVLALMHLAFDDYELSAEERRAKETADPEFRAEKDHERFWHDSGGGEGMQTKRRFEREAHPDLPRA